MLQRQRNPDAKLILIGHSMGGLVARYFLECLDGWRDTRMLITFGTPHRGFAQRRRLPRQRVRQEARPAEGRRPDDAAALADVGVPAAARSTRASTSATATSASARWVTGCRASTRARAAAALTDFHRAIEAGVAAHEPGRVRDPLGRRASPRARSSPADWRATAWSIEETHGGEDMGGDGTVPRVSATPIETDDAQPAYQPMYSSERHGSLQTAEAVQTQLLGILTARPRTGFRAVQGVRLEADELLATGEPLVVRALPDRRRPHDAGRRDRRRHRPGRRRADGRLRRDADEVHHAEIAPLPAGDYRLRVEGVGDSAGLADPVHGLVCVVDDAEPDVDPSIAT